MDATRSVVERLVLGLGAVIIGIPGARLVFGTEGYVDGKQNLTLTPDLFSELRALGAIFLAAAVVMVLGSLDSRMRLGALIVGLVAYLPQGIARLSSYALDDGQHESYLRAGVVETVLGIAIAVFAFRRIDQEQAAA